MGIYYAVEFLILVAVVLFLTGTIKFRKKDPAEKKVEESMRLAERKNRLAALKKESRDVTQTIAVTKELKELEELIKASEEELDAIENKQQ